MKFKLLLLVTVLLVIATIVIAQDFGQLFLDQYNKLQSSEYWSAEGYPYHAIETCIVEATDQGHVSVSETMSYWMWLEAWYGEATGNFGGINTVWSKMEGIYIPSLQDGLSNYDPSSPATYAAEWDTPDQYPSELMFDYPVGTDPIGRSLINTYGGKLYGMHWLVDCDDFYGMMPSTNKRPVLINTFQRGPQESTWETVPQPCVERFQWGGPNGFLDLFTGDQSYSQQWKYTNAPDADMRAVQAMYWAAKFGYSGSGIQNAAKIADCQRLAMFDKYFKTISTSTTPQTGGSGYDGCHYLMSWYYAWGGGLGASWAWIIGCSYCHWGYQNPMQAWISAGLSDQGNAFVGSAQNCASDWQTSLQRQLELYEWLQASNGTFGGGVTNSWKGRYLSYPSGQATFHGMAYDEAPSYHDPPSNTWTGWLGWSAERLCELYYVTDTYDSQIGPILDKWFGFLETHITTGANWRVPAKLSWSGQPGQGLNSTVTNYNQDVGVASSMCQALLWYGAASGNTDATDLAVALLNSMIDNNLDSYGVAADDPRDDYTRFDDTVYIPSGWSGTYPDGTQIQPGITFIDLRRGYLNDPSYQDIRSQLNSGQTPVTHYHRFWANCDFAVALAVADYLGAGGSATATPITTATPIPTVTPTPTGTTTPTPIGTITPTEIGDTNGDNSIDIIDALLLAQYYVGLDPANFNIDAADTNCDGSVDIIDALLISQYYVGLIEGFCL